VKSRGTGDFRLAITGNMLNLVEKVAILYEYIAG
jgi:hypothetical protein